MEKGYVGFSLCFHRLAAEKDSGAEGEAASVPSTVLGVSGSTFAVTLQESCRCLVLHWGLEEGRKCPVSKHQ